LHHLERKNTKKTIVLTYNKKKVNGKGVGRVKREWQNCVLRNNPNRQRWSFHWKKKKKRGPRGGNKTRGNKKKGPDSLGQR